MIDFEGGSSQDRKEKKEKKEPAKSKAPIKRSQTARRGSKAAASEVEEVKDTKKSGPKRSQTLSSAVTPGKKRLTKEEEKKK
jgi:predicted trehalose synthase